MDVIIDDYKLLLDERKKGSSFYPTGERRLDKIMTYGFAPCELTSIAGRPSNGKSLVAEDYARRSSNMGINTAIFNLEMKNRNVVDRLLCMGTQMDPTRLVKCFDQVSESEQVKLYQELDRMSGSMSLMMYDKPMLDIDGFVAIVSQAQEKLKNQYMIVYLDLATKLTDFSRSESALDFQRACDRMQNETKKLGIHTVMLLQINRSSDKEKITSINDAYKIYPNFSQIKNSGAFEEVSDNILLVSKPSNYLNKYEWGEFVPSHIRVELAKQRGGAPATISDVLLYKLNNNYLGLINPEENWDPLKISLDQNDISSYLRRE
jgi:replicative DNA helicase